MSPGDCKTLLFVASGQSHVPQTHREEQRQEEEDVRALHRERAAAEVAAGASGADLQLRLCRSPHDTLSLSLSSPSA